jgi:hypothetical protein
MLEELQDRPWACLYPDHGVQLPGGLHAMDGQGEGSKD